MKIRGQQWFITNKHLVLYLNQPYWGAFQRFNWLEGTEGYSISEEALNKAKELKKKILIKNKYGQYEITTNKASHYLNCKFQARDNTTLICLPRFAFKKLPEPADKADRISIPFDVRLRLAQEWKKIQNRTRESQTSPKEVN